MSRPKPAVKGLDDRIPSRKFAVNDSGPHGKSASSHTSQPHSPDSNSGLVSDDSASSAEDQDPDVPSSPDSPPITSILRPETADSQAHNTFLIMEEESQDESLQGGHTSPKLVDDKVQTLQPPRDETGSSFDELIDRLLSLPISKHDGKFVPVFLCLYRKFAPPLQVFSAITNRFARVEHSDAPQLIKVGEQLRYLQVLALWSGDYPGDFAQPSIKRDATAFVSRLEKSRVFTYAAKEILSHLELATVDEDAQWGRFDDLDTLKDAGESVHSQSGATSPSILTRKSSAEDFLKSSKQS